MSTDWRERRQNVDHYPICVGARLYTSHSALQDIHCGRHSAIAAVRQVAGACQGIDNVSTGSLASSPESLRRTGGDDERIASAAGADLGTNVPLQVQVETKMFNFKSAIHTTLLLVDDEPDQLELRALALKAFGFVVLTASRPVEAIAILAQCPARKVDVAILDYEMPVINGCVLAEYLRSRYPELKIMLYSGAVSIPETEMGSIDLFVPKDGSIQQLLACISELTQLCKIHQKVGSEPYVCC